MAPGFDGGLGDLGVLTGIPPPTPPAVLPLDIFVVEPAVVANVNGRVWVGA